MIHITALSVCRSRHRHVFPLSVLIGACFLMSGCDSQSANSSVRSQVAKSVDSQESELSQPDDLALDEQASLDVADATTEVSGRSLLASAQTDTLTSALNTPKAQLLEDSDSLEATLIGDYGGTMPCANCERVDVTLNLFSDGSVAKTSVYQTSEDKPQSITLSGIYRQDADTITIVYEDQALESYDIEGNYLVRLNADDQPDDNYTLSRL